MEPINFCLFGPPRLERAGQAISISRRKMLALLAYLLITRQPHSREALATLFWPEFDSSSALANLRRDLSRLKEILGDGYLQIGREKVQIDRQADWMIDIIQFEALIEEAETHGHFKPGAENINFCHHCQGLLERAARLYTGEFMAGFNLPDSPAFDDWQYYQKEHLRGLLIGVLDRLIQWRISIADYKEAIELARRWLALDPLHEPVQRLIMQLFAWMGQSSAARRQYNLLVELLERELGVEPESETTALYEAIRTRRIALPEKVARDKPDASDQAPAGSPVQLDPGKRYTRENRLAQGGFGDIYRGRDQVSGKVVAIKRIQSQWVQQNPEILERLKREREILSRLSHPNIVPMLDFYEQDGEYNLVMEYIPGGSLRDRIMKEPSISLEQALDLAIELADALSRAHHLHVLHRDIKPENILLDSAGRPYLIDFGLAFLDTEHTRLTQAGLLIGSPAYMSPEALNGQDLDVRSDIWSFGVLLYEMLAGRPPFEGDQIHTLMQQIIYQDPPLLREYCPIIPEDLEHLVSQMLEKDRENRLPSMRQVSAALESVRSGRKQIPTQGTSPAYDHFHLFKLPAQATPLIGREKELLQINDLLMNPDCRLVTIVGPGGIGKTRLAVEAAARAAKAMPNGAVFISLASATEVDNVLLAIANAIHIRYSPGAASKEQLFHRLSELKMLLILDNFEQLLPASGFLVELLAAASHLRLLVTSRERLNILEEWAFEVQGLPFPLASEPFPRETESWLRNFSAVHLFIERTRRVLPDLHIDEETLRDIIRVCQLVEGMPLALELAAPWIRVMSCKEIVRELEQGIDLLTTSLRNLPERHRSIRVIFDQSWQALSPVEQNVLARLSVFHNGCSREAAEKVASARLNSLTALVDKALLRYRANRYEMHGLVRQYAAERLGERPQEQEEVLDRHHRYYLNLVEQLTPWLKGGRQIEASQKFILDINNIRSAWRRAVQRSDFDALFQAAEAYWLFHEFSGLLAPGETGFRLAAEAVIPSQENKAFQGFFRAAQGSLLARQWHFEQGRDLMEQGLTLLREADPQNPERIAFTLAWLSFLNVMHGEYQEGVREAEESLSYFPQTGDRWTQAGALRLLGAATLYQGRLLEAQDFLDQCVAVCKSIGELRIRTYATSNLGVIHLWYGQIDKARQNFDESLRISKSCNDRLARADALVERSRLFIATGEYDQAIDTARSCTDLYYEMGRTNVSLANILLGIALRLKGVEGAADAIQKGLEAAKLVGHRPDIASAFEGLGVLAYDQKEYTLAQEYFQQSLAIWEEIGHEPEIAMILCRISALQAISDSPDFACIQAQLVRALRLARKHQAAMVGLSALAGLEALRVLLGDSLPAENRLSDAFEHPNTTLDTRRWIENSMGQASLQALSLFDGTEISLTNWQALAERWENAAI